MNAFVFSYCAHSKSQNYQPNPSKRQIGFDPPSFPNPVAWYLAVTTHFRSDFTTDFTFQSVT